MIDWSACEDAERITGKVSGAWLVKGTRIPVQAVLDNAEDGYSAEQIADEIYEGLPVDGGAAHDRVREAVCIASCLIRTRHANCGRHSLAMTFERPFRWAGMVSSIEI
jgi:hypothetical protein